jgi:hypothetical protein
MESIKFSKYSSVKSKEKIDIDIIQYCTIVKTGLNQDLVLKARAAKAKGEDQAYKDLKMQAAVITGSVVMKSGEKTAANIEYYNGLILIDVDTNVTQDQIEALKKDRYTYILHRSFGGEGVCIFVKIDPEKFKESFEGLAQYYYSNFGLVADRSCSNPNRLRYISFDPDLFENKAANKFKSKAKQKEIKESNYIFSDSDFGFILDQIRSRSIDLCKDDYSRYMRIGFALFDKFGETGFHYFDEVCRYGSKYDSKAIQRHWKSFSRDGKTTIATFYHLCKEEGIDIYSKETKETIKAVKLQKTQGTPTVKSVTRHLTDVCGVENPDEKLIQDLILSKKDFAKDLDHDESDISRLEKFIIDGWQPKTNELTNDTFVKNGIRLDDKQLNNIYIAATKYFDFNISKNDVRDIINSDCVPTYNPVKKYFIENKEEYTDEVQRYIGCIHPVTEYNQWAIQKWMIGCIHNWLADMRENKVSPLTLVLCGQKQGTGKTSFFREMLPIELKIYLAETKIDLANKDSLVNMTKNLIVLDDEFGGLAIKDVRDFKKMADTNIIDMRLPYGTLYSKFKRRAALAGTSNEVNILKDVTGNRRILPIQVDRIDYDVMVLIDKDKMWRQVYDLYLSGIDWKIYKDSDVEYLRVNTVQNVEVLPIEELFWKLFSLERRSAFSVRVIMNQGEILDYMTRMTQLKPTKFDLKDIFVKNKLNYRTHRVDGGIKSGVELWIETGDIQAAQNIPAPF